MAAAPWNRVNIPFPGAVSSVRIQFSPTTDANVKNLLAENNKVLRLIRSEILQTEIRVLYELLYILNNSFRGNRTLRGLKQVEQCVNRLRDMKLDVALEELKDLCPNRIQRGLGIKTNVCDVPSQPMLEWVSLKVLGAAQLMSCTLNRCSKAFILSKQQMKLMEFVIMNVVITSMLSRLWVMFRGILLTLSGLYRKLLEFLTEVSQAHPMPFLLDFSLPADMAQFLPPPDAFLLRKHSKCDSHAKDHKGKQQQQKKKKKLVGVKSQGQTWKLKEDLGVAVERGIFHDTDLKPFLKVREFLGRSHKAVQGQKFKKQMREATTFTDMAAHLDEMISWCRSQRKEKEKRLLIFLRLKCHKMKCLEAAGYNIKKKLKRFKQEACWAASPQGSAPRTCRSPATMRGRLQSRCQSLKSGLRASTAKTGVKKKRQRRQKKKNGLSMSGLSASRHQRSRTTPKATPQTTDCGSHDDIDDIFASIDNLG